MYGSALEIIPMGVWKLPKGKEYMKSEVCNSGKYFAQTKKDGCCYVYEKDSEGNSYLFSRAKSKKTGHLAEKSANVPHIMNFLDNAVPRGTIIIGEIFFPNGNSTDVTEIMGCKSYKALARQSFIENDSSKEYKKALKDYEPKGIIHYYMFDMLYWGGVSLLDYGHLDRYKQLKKQVNMLNLVSPEFMELADCELLDLEEFIDKNFKSGEEGTVLKLIDGNFISGKKTAWSQIKFKIEDTHDVICIGFEKPTRQYTGKEIETWQYWEDNNANIYIGKNEFGYMTPVTKPYAKGWIGAIKVGVYKNGEIVEVGTVSSGLTDELCEAIKKNPDDFIGQPMEVKCMMAFEGKLRHGVFKRFRNDIDIEDCCWEKIF